MPHRYGGPWTELKLDILKQYLTSYTEALKLERFEKWYIDAFAGTGDRQETKEVERDLFRAGGIEEQSFDGSAKIALQVSLPFDRYYFIENDSERYGELQKLPARFPSANILCQRGEPATRVERG